MIWTLLAASLALASTAEIEHKAGVDAQVAGDATAALVHYGKCLELAPDNVPCHWEIGWSYWTEGDWAHVVEHWARVKELQPGHPEVDRHLPAARAHLESLAAIREAGKSAPGTVRVPPPEGWTIRLRAVGDIMMGTDFPDPKAYLPPKDGVDLLAGVSSLLQDADLTFGNLEGPLCDGGTTNKCAAGDNCFAFRTPTRYGKYLVDAGFDVVSTANNHAEDFGSECRTQTENTLDALGIAFSGRPGTVASLTHEGVKIALIGFHTSRNSHYVNDFETAAQLVRALDANHDLVIVSFHGGAEGNNATHVPDKMEKFYGEDRGHLRAFAKTVVEAGADLILGHGPHVVRGMQLINGHLAVYSMGNFATYGRFGLDRHLATSEILEVVMDAEGKLVSGRIFPIHLEGEGIPMPDPNNTAIDLIRSLSTEDFGESAPIIGQDGSFAPR